MFISFKKMLKGPEATIQGIRKGEKTPTFIFMFISFKKNAQRSRSNNPRIQKR
jgi:hypothetical protein